MSEPLDPTAFAARLNEWKRGTMIEYHGTQFITAGQGRAVARLDFKPELTQLTGLFHAGAIIALADETATVAAMWETNPTGEFKPELFPLTLQLSTNLIRNTNHGTLTAEAQVIHRGRTTIVVEVKVTDDRPRLIATLVATLLVPTPSEI
ncbi:MAG: PaaI family thioesterase [Candidatus Tectomicrobia bacterium]|nr:PaaI family thioesterase [Candidatus Tectomicrobia bacterium]